MNKTRSELLIFIRSTFSEEELKTISFQLDVDYEDLPALGKGNKARELVDYLERQGRLAELQQLVAQKRPFTIHPFEPETVRIPAGTFLMGDDDLPHASPQHEVTLPTYYIGKYPVTNREYGRFVQQTKHPVPQYKKEWFSRQPRREYLDYPVVGVAWHDAVAYCQWLAAYTNRAYRLPTEAEWERAARGMDGRLYPWGNEWREDGILEARTAVTDQVANLSPDGCAQMVGYIEQWTSTIWGSNHREPDFAYPYAADGRDEINSPTYLRRIYRGSIVKVKSQRSRAALRGHDQPQAATHFRGFRVARTP